MRLLITDTVPLNGGDEALLRATIGALRRRFAHARIDVLCKDVQRCRALLPDLRLASDLMFARDDDEREAAVEMYRMADVVISAPGGFLSDYYAMEGRLTAMETALDMGKPVMIFAQSIGPLDKPESRRRVGEVLGRCAAVALRDARSRELLADCGVDPGLLHVTADAAFLWRMLDPGLLRRRVDARVRTIGMCFRPWPLRGDEEHARLAEKAAALTRQLLESDANRRLRFLSTCQGVEGYKDDSDFAKRIVGLLPGVLRGRCDIDAARYGPTRLIGELARIDAMISMRLHGCLLAMLGGCAAMGVGYECKTREVFRQLGFERYTVEQHEPAERWIETVEAFFSEIGAVRASLPGALDVAAERAHATVGLVAQARAREVAA
jgi:colanic acid/amylovoran biosynthesis protein